MLDEVVVEVLDDAFGICQDDSEEEVKVTMDSL